MLHSNNLFNYDSNTIKDINYDSNTIKDTVQGSYSLSVSESLEEM